MPTTLPAQTAKPAPLQLDCWICPDCGGNTTRFLAHVGGKGDQTQVRCLNEGCGFQSSEAFLIRMSGLCGKAA